MVSERSWLITLKAKGDLTEPARHFHFARAKLDGTEMTYQRYQDADLVNSNPEVSLEATYGTSSQPWLYWLAGGGVLAAMFVAVLAWRRRRPDPKKTAGWTLPQTLTPFTVATLRQ